jgi:hypothetical protein
MKKDNLDIEELLSAYLDGELSEKERLYVEQRLSEDAEVMDLFKQIRRVSQEVSALPMASAPKELAGNIQYELERDFLLGKEDVLSELAGEKHLQVRWLVSAAAVLILAGVIVTVVFTVLKNPADSGFPPDPPGVVMIPSEVPVEAVARIIEQDPDPETPALQYSRLKLSVQSLKQDSVEPTVERFLESHEIDQVIRNKSSEGAMHYAFSCMISQLDDLVVRLRSQNECRFDLQTPNTGTDTGISVQGVSKKQIMQVASLGSETEQFAYIAGELSRQNREASKSVTRSETPEKPLPLTPILESHVSGQGDMFENWMDDFYVANETAPSQLRMLSPELDKTGKEITDPDILEAISANDPNKSGMDRLFLQMPGNEQSARELSPIEEEKMVAVVLVCRVTRILPDLPASMDISESALADPNCID